MNINPEFDFHERPNMEESMEAAMSYLYQKFIKPLDAEVDETTNEILTTIAIMFKDMAEKAEAYYQMEEGKENDFYRN